MKDDPPPVAAAIIAVVIALALIVLGLVVLRVSGAHARDVDGRYAQSPLKPWFDGLKSKRGDLCCSFADGTVVDDPDWQIASDGHYRVKIDGEWIDVPDSAVITEPNRVGHTMVWPMRGALGVTVRCFLPGAMI